MTRYLLTEVYEVDADSEVGAWVALASGDAERVDGWCIPICPVCGDEEHDVEECAWRVTRRSNVPPDPNDWQERPATIKY